VNTFLDSLGAPAAQHLDTAKAANAANVLYGLGGEIPSSSLAREGAAFTAAANTQPATVIGQGLQNSANEIQAGRDKVTKLAQDLVNLESNRPGLIQSALANLQQTNMQNAGLDQNAKLLGFTVAKDYENNFPGIDPFTGKPTKTQTTLDAKTEPKLDSSLSRTFGYRVDQFGNPWGGKLILLPGFDIDRSGQVVKSATKLKTRPLTQPQRQKLTSDANAAAAQMSNGFEDAKHTVHPPIQYDEALLEMEKQGYFGSKELRQIALSALWNVYGRPAVVGPTGPLGLQAVVNP
jgi:hypothetical protein